MQSSEEFWEQSFEEIIATIPDLFFDDPFPPPGLSPWPARSIGPGPKGSPTGPRGRVGKPVARKARPRPSKKAPATTLLAADPGNFRALVQQFTGRRSEGPLLRAYKGPINLNFKQRSFYPVDRNLEESDRRFLPFGGKIDDSAANGRDRVEFDEDFGDQLIVSSQSDGNDHALTCDGDFDVSEDGFWGREVEAGGGGCDAVLAGAVDPELWGTRFVIRFVGWFG
ncbi:hypothetical protein SASPL_144498 [Salvia splendens]|uniref:VQ domain-containing protein n=1 Tax=Salvia splendens TaxID=180675 RepID=A0A8X8WFE1_SALSN|nr:hypothetical protein SASPL_144498 [Salvia splendens]